MAENLLEIKNLKKYFSTPRGDQNTINNLTLKNEKGQFFSPFWEIRSECLTNKRRKTNWKKSRKTTIASPTLNSQ